ncbi:MAG: hypothetical protein K0Q80_284 [Microvirga sp.]|nr:hypothetical protein [Microvirga sp.]
MVIHAKVQIGKVQGHEPVKGVRKMRQSHLVMADLDGKCVTPSSLMQAEQPESNADQGRVREPVLTIEKLGALAQGLNLLLRFSPERLYDVGVTKTRREAGKRHLFVECETRFTRQ